VLGLILSLWLTRFLAGMLFGVTPNDPVVLVAVVALVLAVATIGSLIPAVRASLIEPVRVLREG
jgi:ABC-type lipoprotein release transport system permease subunit